MSVQRHSYIALVAIAAGAISAPTVWAQDSSSESEGIEEIKVFAQKRAYRGDTPLSELPQAVQEIDSELISQIGAIQFQTVLDYAGSVARQNSFGGLWDSFAVRGFAGDENLPSGYLVNGFSAGRGYSGRRDSVNIESVEILKGPGSALYGRSEPGGTINIVTKKPQFEKAGHVGFSAGSYDTYRLEADYTGPLSDSVAFRINGAYDDAGSFRNEVTSERYAFSPSLLWRMSDSTSLTYELELLNQEAPFDRGIVTLNNDFNYVPISSFFGEPNDGDMSIEALGHQLTLQRDLDNGWSVLAGMSFRTSSFEGFSSSTELGGRQLLPTDGITVSRQRRHRDYDADDFSARFEFSGSMEMGNTVHHVLIGADTYDYSLDQIQQRWRVAWGSGDDTYSVNVFDPVYGQPKPPLGAFQDTEEEQQSTGIYFQDQIDISDRFKMQIGLRYDDFSQKILNNRTTLTSRQSQTAFSPRIGFAYDVTENLTLYTAYSEGFRPNVGADVDGVAFEPEESDSFEVGFKMSMLEERLNTTVAVFQARKTNVVTADPIRGGSITAGEAESDGIELDMSGELSDTLRVLLTYAYIDARTTESNRIIPGTPLINVPDHSANIMLVKDFSINDADFDAGLSVQYVGERVGQTLNPDFRLPSYTLAKLMLGYEPNEKVRLSLDVDNLFDETYFPSSYWSYWVMPGTDRSFTFRVRYQL